MDVLLSCPAFLSCFSYAPSMPDLTIRDSMRVLVAPDSADERFRQLNMNQN